jgi:DNA repair exonuclease SbcCD nuclease subunit
MACNKLKADGAIIAGDLYNLKKPARNSHRLNQDLIKEFGQFECPIYMIEGNHDLTGNQLDSLEEQPLGVLFADKTLIQLRHEIVEKNGDKISLVGVPYQEGLDLSSLNLPSKEGCASQICAMHLYAGLKSGYLFQDRLYGYDELAELSPDVFVIGHYHIDQGIYKEGEKYFVNIGSMSRGTLSDEDIEHHPQIGYIKITVDGPRTTYKLQPIRLKIRPASEVFDIEKREEEKKELKEIEKFVEKLATETEEDSEKTEKTIDGLIQKIDMTKAVRERVMSFIQEASLKK